MCRKRIWDLTLNIRTRAIRNTTQNDLPEIDLQGFWIFVAVRNHDCGIVFRILCRRNIQSPTFIWRCSLHRSAQLTQLIECKKRIIGFVRLFRVKISYILVILPMRPTV